MMPPLKTSHTNAMLGAPVDWDAAVHGECIGLPVHRDPQQGVWLSWYQPTEQDIANILAGVPIRLSIFSNEQPHGGDRGRSRGHAEGREVTVKVLGLAASAASIIAMAGDKVQIARAGFLMIHNAWVMAIGNRNDLIEVAATLQPFDDAMASIYSARSGQDIKAMAKLMDAETWIGGQAAVDDGFADELLPSDQVKKGEGKASASAVRRIEAALRSSGMPKSEALRLISDFKSSSGDPAGSGEGDPTERVEPRPDSLSSAAALAASLISINA